MTEQQQESSGNGRVDGGSIPVSKAAKSKPAKHKTGPLPVVVKPPERVIELASIKPLHNLGVRIMGTMHADSMLSAEPNKHRSLSLTLRGDLIWIRWDGGLVLLPASAAVMIPADPALK